MPRVALGVLPNAVSAPSRRSSNRSYAGAYAEGQVDADGIPRRSNLYADGMSTPTVGVPSCPSEAVRRDGPDIWPSAYTLAIGVSGHSCSDSHRSYEEETSIARGGEEQVDVKMDVKLDKEDMDARGGSGRNAREEKKKSRPVQRRSDRPPRRAVRLRHSVDRARPPTRFLENKDSADIINWREFEALRNEMRREFRAQDDVLNGKIFSVLFKRYNWLLTISQTNINNKTMMKTLNFKMTHTMLVVRHVVIVLVVGLHLAAMGRGQDEEDGLGKPKFSIPKFEGGADVEEYLTWKLKIEKLWSLHPNYSEDRKIKIASSEFDGYALRWWDSFVRNRDEDGAEPIRTWRAMKEAMTPRFVPTNYLRDIFDKLTLLRQGVKTVDEYYMEMEMLMQRGRVRESLEMTMQCFLNGLKYDVKGIVRHYSYTNMNQLLHHAREAESRLKKQRLKDVLRELGVYTPCALICAGAFDALRSLLYSA
ncbi:hypothetical protein QYE76_051666 [Lolium multiflorum]|uniref:Retrotransposon gag domain-containing protein n=1 Tax=Lolium multiflorum TaxID=4521 RepID=A0AAD8SS97_LOLMU|nr:hypothetical protein QYE76_051666 [Lolium multiflorum]